MSRRIQARRWQVGSEGGLDPEDIEALEQRREKHARMMQKPARPFGEILRDRIKADSPEQEEESEAEADKGAKDPLLGLAPNQNAKLANTTTGRRSGRVIVKG
ncbi:MAG: hypothetical protein AAFN74_18000 [Myxococcota bacterium]